MYHSVATRSCCSTCEGARLPALLKHAHVRPRAEALWLLAVLAARLVSCLWSLRRAPARCCHQLASSCVQPRAAARALSSCGRLGASCPSLGRSARAAATGGSRLLVRQPLTISGHDHRITGVGSAGSNWKVAWHLSHVSSPSLPRAGSRFIRWALKQLRARAAAGPARSDQRARTSAPFATLPSRP